MTATAYAYNVFLFCLMAAIVWLPEISNWWVLLPAAFINIHSKDESDK
jgi:hypothetical protein